MYIGYKCQNESQAPLNYEQINGVGNALSMAVVVKLESSGNVFCQTATR